ncbi:unnamed protein product [Spodoptera littoralis]|uniref:Uncharacterized protein n=1 Tax=Spodoptera littoralis TaxID=7109 RepID=A0A9P0HX29_SPOLI|nr:unnamed protein product [Spodoptera littoralis]CAH1636994.1 unnamed protein product [Spodoptera littoralis]
MTIRRRKAARGESARDFCTQAATIGDIITSLHLNCGIKASRVCRALRQGHISLWRSDYRSAKGGVERLYVSKVSGRRTAGDESLRHRCAANVRNRPRCRPTTCGRYVRNVTSLR